jgi:hypothetical protein
MAKRIDNMRQAYVDSYVQDMSKADDCDPLQLLFYSQHTGSCHIRY